MTTSHTPGPWHRMDSTQVIGACGSHVADCAHENTSGPNNPTLMGAIDCANARLISAAPDMLEALQIASVSCGFQKLNTVAKKRILSAITKATGA